MAFDFPAAPAVDQIYTDAVSGLSYVFDGVMWKQGTTTSGPPGDAWVLKVGDTMTGALVLPDPNPVSPLQVPHKRYVDQTVAANALYQGTWQVAANIPDLNVPPNTPLNGYSWIAQTADPGTPELAAATIPGIGGSSIAALDTVRWNAVSLEYDHIRGATAISQMTISDAAPATAFHGQCWWDSDSGKQYVYYDDGTSQAWVQMSGGGGGQASVTVSPTAPTAPTKGMLWYDTTTGEMNVYYDDGTTQQWVQCNVEEAPVDGQSYVRNNADWVVGGAGGGGIVEAPNDGVQYTRGAPAAGGTVAWTALAAAATGDFLPRDGSLSMTGSLELDGANYHSINKPASTDWAGFFLGSGGANKWEWDLTDNLDNIVLRRFGPPTPAIVVQHEHISGATTYFGPLSIRGTGGAFPIFSIKDEFIGNDIWRISAAGTNLGIMSFTAAAGTANPGDKFQLDCINNRADFYCPVFVQGAPVTMMSEHQAALDKIAALEQRLAALEKRVK